MGKKGRVRQIEFSQNVCSGKYGESWKCQKYYWIKLKNVFDRKYSRFFMIRRFCRYFTDLYSLSSRWKIIIMTFQISQTFHKFNLWENSNSIHFEKKLYFALATKLRTFKIMMMNFIFWKKAIFPNIIFIGSYNIIWKCKVKVWRHTDVTLKPNVRTKNC